MSFQRPTALRTRVCSDGAAVRTRAELLEIGPPADRCTAPRNGVVYRRGRTGEFRLGAAVSGGTFDRKIETTVRGADEAVEVTLPPTVCEVGSGAFGSIQGLRRAVLGEKTKVLSEFCFAYTGLSALEVPAGVEEIGVQAFFYCIQLRKVDFGEAERLRAIGARAFAGSGIERLETPAGLQELGESAFAGCRDLRKVTLNAGLEVLGPTCFEGVKPMRVEVPGSLRRVGKNAFLTEKLVLCLPPEAKQVSAGWLAQSGAPEVEIPAGVEEICERAFFGARQLRAVVFAESSALKRISAEAFAGSGITELELPDGVTSIGDRAFAGCEKLTELVFGENSALAEIG